MPRPQGGCRGPGGTIEHSPPVLAGRWQIRPCPGGTLDTYPQPPRRVRAWRASTHSTPGPDAATIFECRLTGNDQPQGPKKAATEAAADKKRTVLQGNLFTAPFASSPTRTGPSFEGSIFRTSEPGFPPGAPRK